MKNSLFAGMDYVWRGFGLLMSPGLRCYVLLPVLMNVIVIGTGSYVLLDWLSGWQGPESEWLQWISWLVVPLAMVAFALVSGYFFSALLLLFASPFFGLLAGELERRYGVEIEDEALMSLIGRTVLRELVKMKYYLPRYLGLLLLSLVPVVNLAMPVVWFWFGSWVLALQYSDYTFDNQNVNFQDTRQRLVEQRWTAWGFGGLVSVLMMVPVLNALVPPAAVIGATIWQMEKQNRRLQDQGAALEAG
ncbi:MAG: sulfate transporter CysZ [Oceanobacter sp.]